MNNPNDDKNRKRKGNHSSHAKDHHHHHPQEESSSAAKNKRTSGACESVGERYEKVGRVGQGTYGVVYKARDRETGEYVALKRCIPHHESSDGFPLTTLRELHALKVCSRHPNVVELLTVAVSTSGVFLVFEYCPQDVAQILDRYYPKYKASPFDGAQVKVLMKQLLSALEFCHQHSLLHRDMKPSNLLYDGSGTLKLADFGLSRHVSNRLTPNVVSLWYRAPELLLQQGHSSYGFAIDLWAVGCVFGELLQGFPLLDGSNETEQVEKLSACLGQPPYGDIPSVMPSKKSSYDLWDRFEYLSADGLSLLTKLMEYRPRNRWTATQALASAYFTSTPLPATRMPKFAPPTF